MQSGLASNVVVDVVTGRLTRGKILCTAIDRWQEIIVPIDLVIRVAEVKHKCITPIIVLLAK